MHLQCKTLIPTKKRLEEFIPIKRQDIEIGLPRQMSLLLLFFG